MGSAASAVRLSGEHRALNAEQCRALLGPLFDQQIFDREAQSGEISLRALGNLQSQMYDVYIAFDWSQKMLEFVVQLEKALENAGFKPCFGGQPADAECKDEEEAKDEKEGDDREQMARSRIKSGITSAACVVVLLTESYVSQICKDVASIETEGNYCLLEFDLVTSVKSPEKVIGIIVDEEVKNSHEGLQFMDTLRWPILLDFTAEAELEEKAAALSEAILQVNGSRILDMNVRDLTRDEGKDAAVDEASHFPSRDCKEDAMRLIELAELHHWLEELLGGFAFGERALQLARDIMRAGYCSKEQLQQAARKDEAILDMLSSTLTDREKQLLVGQLLPTCTAEEKRSAPTTPVSQADAMDVMDASCLRLARRLKKLGMRAAALRSLGFSLDHIWQAGFSLEALLEAKFDLDSLLKHGWTESEITCSMRIIGRKPAQCRAFGLSLELIYEEYSISELLASGVLREPLQNASLEQRLVTELADLGLSCKQLIAKRVPLHLLARYPSFFPVKQLLALGYTPLALYEAGCPGMAVGQTLVEMGYSLRECLDVGLHPRLLRELFSLAQFLEEACPVGVLKEADFPLADLRAAGLTGWRLRQEGFSASELEEAGLSPREVFSLTEMKEQGKSIAQLREQGWGMRSLVIEGGWPLSELLAAGGTWEEAQAAGLLLPPLEPTSSTATAMRARSLRPLRCVHSFPPEKGDQGLCVISSTTIAAAGMQGGSIVVWDLSDGQCLGRFHGHNQAVLCLALLDSRLNKYAIGRSGLPGLQLISGSADFTLRLWNIATGRCVGTFIGHTRSVRAVVVLSNQRQMLSGSYDDSLRLWDVRCGQCLAIFRGHEAAVRCLAILPGGKLAVSGSADESLRVWRIDRKKAEVCLNVLRGHTDWVNSVAPHPIQKRIVLSGSEDGTIRTWDVASGVCLRVLDMREKGTRGLGIAALCLFPQERGRWVVAADSRGVLSLCDLGSVPVDVRGGGQGEGRRDGEQGGEEGDVCGVLAEHASAVLAMHGSCMLAEEMDTYPLGAVHLLSVGKDGVVKVWTY